MWYKMIWGLSVLAVVLLIGFSMLIISTQMELKQMREEAKATEIRMQEQKDHVHADNGEHAGHSELEQDTETTVEPNNPVNINESGNMTKTTETFAVGIGANGEVFRYKDGIYKGMTYPEAVKFWRKRVNGAKKEYNDAFNTCNEIEKALINMSHSGMAILFTGLRKLPSDVYERAMDQVFKNDPNGREKFEAYMNEVEKYSYSNSESLEDQASRFKNERGSRQMLRESLDALRPERDRLQVEYDKIFLETPLSGIRRNKN